MSLGPREQRAEIKVSRFDRLRHQVNVAVKEYFQAPLHYLFYGMLGLTIVGLFLGLHFAWEYYAILMLLAAERITNAYRHGK